MNSVYEGSRHAVQRQIARAIARALLITAAIGASAEPEMTFKLSAINSSAASAFQSEMRRAWIKVREWWGATFEGSISIQTNTERVLSMALIPAWRGERGQIIFGAKRVNAGEAATVHEMIHVYAPNANRFLAEGLAVYGHDLLGGPPTRILEKGSTTLRPAARTGSFRRRLNAGLQRTLWKV